MVRAAILLLSMTAPAAAFSGAEFLSSNSDFADGYAWGVLEARLMLTNSGADHTRQMELWDCIGGANVSSSVFGDAVRNTISKDAAFLTDPALRAVIVTVNKMCPDE